VWEALAQAFEQDDRIAIDLSGVTFLDSSGLTLFVRAHKRATRNGGRLVLRSPQAQARKVFDLTGLRQDPRRRGPETNMLIGRTPAEMDGLAVPQHVTEGVPCLWPRCDGSVAFAGIGDDKRRHGTCPSGHRHYSDDSMRYGTER
jgi:ABC-type transporter Mla MlaB component